jgi:hypothetical protein
MARQVDPPAQHTGDRSLSPTLGPTQEQFTESWELGFTNPMDRRLHMD